MWAKLHFKVAARIPETSIFKLWITTTKENWPRDTSELVMHTEFECLSCLHSDFNIVTNLDDIFKVCIKHLSNAHLHLTCPMHLFFTIPSLQYFKLRHKPHISEDVQVLIGRSDISGAATNTNTKVLMLFRSCKRTQHMTTHKVRYKVCCAESAKPSYM